MLTDLILLLRLRLQLLMSSLRLALSFLGYDTEDRSLIQRLYGVYVLGFLALWLVLMGSWSLFTAGQVAAALSPQTRANGLNGLPWVLFGGQVIITLGLLRSAPLKLSFPDMAYVAGSPLSRRAVALDGLLRSLALTLPLVGWGLVLAGVVLTPAVNAAASEAAGWRVGTLALPWATFVLALAWLLGLARLRLPAPWRLALWLVPLAAIGLAFLPGQITLAPARAVVAAAIGLPTPLLLLMIALAVLMTGVLLWLSGRLNLSDIVDESQTYAQLRSIGLYALLDFGMATRSIRQVGRRGGTRVRGSLPRREGVSGLFGRALLGYQRRPFALLTSLIWGAALLATGANTLLAHPPLQVLLTWLFASLLFPPSGLVMLFRSDVELPFLRQLLPFDLLTLLVVNALPALLLLLLGGAVSAIVQGTTATAFLAAMVLALPLACVALMCVGLSLVPINRRGGRIPYAALAAGSLGLICLFSRWTTSVFALAMVAAFIALVLSRWLRWVGR